MEKYYFGIGQVRSLEAHLLTPEQLTRMAQAADFETALAVLSETTYAETLAKVKQAFDFEELCELELLALKDLIEDLSLGQPFIKALFKKYDYLNIKILLRAQNSPITDLTSYVKTGTVPFDKLKAYILEGQKTLDDQELILAINRAVQVVAETHDPQLLEAALDQDYYRHLKSLSKTSCSRLIQNMVKHQLDLINIKTLLRLQALKKTTADLEIFLLETGLIDQASLVELFDKSPSELIPRLAYTVYAPDINKGLEHYLSHKSFSLLEKVMADFILNQFKRAKYLGSGLEPLVGFYLAKENELKTIRFILISKKNFVKSEEIRERMKASY